MGETATINHDLIPIACVDRNLGMLTVSVPSGWDDVKQISKHVLIYAGHLYTFTGWNSDRNEAYFKWTRQVARIHQ